MGKCGCRRATIISCAIGTSCSGGEGTSAAIQRKHDYVLTSLCCVKCMCLLRSKPTRKLEACATSQAGCLRYVGTNCFVPRNWVFQTDNSQSQTGQPRMRSARNGNHQA